MNITTLHWSQLVGIFVTLHQTRDIRVSHTAALEIQYPPANAKHNEQLSSGSHTGVVSVIYLLVLGGMLVGASAQLSNVSCR